jgi:WXG100 family type VII secretion target
MAAPKFRGDYSQLNHIAQKFKVEQVRAQRALDEIHGQVSVLRGGDWVGQGARKFYDEMDTAVLPGLRRLIEALGQAATVTGRISGVIQQAEADAARILDKEPEYEWVKPEFVLDGAQGLPGADPAQVVLDGMQFTGLGNTGSGGGGGGFGDGLGQANSNPLVVRDVNEQFTEKAMHDLVGKQYQGADSERLRNAMKTLYELRKDPNNPAVAAALAEIAAQRGVPLDKIKADYAKYQQILAQQEAAIAAGKGEPPGLDIEFHRRFMGSTSQLRYGAIVGDAFGIDSVFGALLNPTGGIAGPGNRGLDLDDSALGYHGAVHDAAGYLYNYHGQGPGYDYLKLENADPANPLSGQREELLWWLKKIPYSGNVGADYISYQWYFINRDGRPVKDFLDWADRSRKTWSENSEIW